MSPAPEPWGGEVGLPRWLRRLLRRPPVVDDTPERRHERHKPEEPTVTVGQNADRAGFGSLTELYHEGRKKRH
jgi:hypothetical protein